MSSTSATVRTTEGSRPGKRGRPAGSKNKSKSLVPAAVGRRLLRNMEEQLSPEQFDYLKGVISEGRPIETRNEIDVLIALLTRNLYPALIQEMSPTEDGGAGGIYRKDVTDRLKIVQGLLNLRHQQDKRDEPDTDSNNTILTVTAKRGFDFERLAILVGKQPDSLVGGADGVGEPADTIRALPNSIPERQVSVSVGEQGETDRVLDSDSVRRGTLSDDEDELQG